MVWIWNGITNSSWQSLNTSSHKSDEEYWNPWNALEFVQWVCLKASAWILELFVYAKKNPITELVQQAHAVCYRTFWQPLGGKHFQALGEHTILQLWAWYPSIQVNMWGWGLLQIKPPLFSCRKLNLKSTSLHKNNIIYIIKQEGLYQNKVNSRLVFIDNCKMAFLLLEYKFF